MRLVEVDTVIVGAGPAGLAVARALRTDDKLVIEAGRPVAGRSNSNAADLLEGVGGAGLYSDGKFSFWPSATELWNLDETALNKANKMLDVLFDEHKIEHPMLDHIGDHATYPLKAQSASVVAMRGVDKHYPSIYVPLETRMKIVESLSADTEVLTDSRVVDIKPTKDGWTLRMVGQQRTTRINCTKLVVAAGRYGPLLTQQIFPSAVHEPRRLEVGVRIEQRTDMFFLRDHPRIDPKIIYQSPDGLVQWRTFCCCRDGMIATGRSYGIQSLSGHADCPPTGRSNVGFNVRLLDKQLIAKEWPALRDRLVRWGGSVRADLSSLLPGAVQLPAEADMLARVLGRQLSARLSEGLVALVQDFSEGQLDRATVAGPTVEGVGMYLRHNSRLETALPGLWVAGDAAGDFRGLTAALISGFVAGIAVSGIEGV